MFGEQRHTHRLGLVHLIVTFALVRSQTRHGTACGASGEAGVAAVPIAGRQVDLSVQPEPQPSPTEFILAIQMQIR